MNDDRCHHVSTAPGQTMCTCLDRRMFLELLIELQARRITELETRVQHRSPNYMTPELHGRYMMAGTKPNPGTAKDGRLKGRGAKPGPKPGSHNKGTKGK